MLVPQQSSWPAQRADSRFHLQWPHDVHAMSIRLRSYSSHPEGKRALCLGGITRTFFAQGFSGSLDCTHRKARRILSGNSHKQALLPSFTGKGDGEWRWHLLPNEPRAAFLALSRIRGECLLELPVSRHDQWWLSWHRKYHFLNHLLSTEA